MKLPFARRPAEPPAGHVAATFTVLGLSCANCAMSVDWAVEALEGVAESTTSFARGETLVVFDPARLAPADVVAAIERAGYRAEPVPTKPQE